MDVVGYLFLTLLGTGYMLNQKDKKDTDTDTKDKKTEKIIENFVNPNKCKDEPILPQEFGSYVTPYFYNTIQLTGATNKIPNSYYDESLMFQCIDPKVKEKLQVKSLSENTQIYKKLNEPNSTKNSGWEAVQPLSNYESVPHDETHLDKTPMTHTNMVPFYKGNITQSLDPNNRRGVHMLELNGTFHLRQHNKKELEPFFAPTTGMTNIYGSVERRELDRYKPSNTGKKHNELPFNQVRVGRGLNGGFTAAPSGGFHDFTRVVPKPNYQLYVNPKSETKGKINAGKAPTENRTLTQVQYKYKPTLLVENKCGERNFTSVGQVRGRKLRPNVVLRDTNRKRHIGIMGHAAPGDTHFNRPENLFAKVRRTHKTNYKNTPYRNAVLADGKKVNDYGKSGYENKPNERTVTGTRTYLSNLTYFVKKIISQFTDTARYTRKQEYIRHARPYGNLNPQRASNLPAYDPKDVARTTIKQTTQDLNRMGISKQIGAGKQRAYDPKDVAKTTIRQTTQDLNRVGITKQLGAGKQKAYDPKDVAKTTIRQTTQDLNRMGISKQIGAGKQKAYDPKDVAKTTIRQTTQDLNRVGISKQIGAGKQPAYDPKDVAKTTIRQTTQDLNRKGIVSNPIQKKHIAYDPKDVAKTTIRQTTQDLNRKGVVSNPIQKKHIAYDPKDVAKTTIKQTTQDMNRKGNVSGGEFQNGGAYKVTNAYANNTNRQFTQDYYWSPAANAVTKKNARKYDAEYNAQVNPLKEIIAQGREPTKQSVKLTNRLANMINYEVKKIDGDSINWRGKVKDSNVGNVFNPNAITKCTNTSIKNNLPEDYTRLDTSLLDAYRRNPLTQSLQSYA